MNSQRSPWRPWALGLVVVLVLLALYVWYVAHAPKVTGRFMGYTEANNRSFVLVSFVNHERVPIQWHDVWVEIDGSSERHGPVVNPNLPWITKPSLAVGDSETLAVGNPDPDRKGRWRVCWAYSPNDSTNNYVATSKWFKP